MALQAVLSGPYVYTRRPGVWAPQSLSTEEALVKPWMVRYASAIKTLFLAQSQGGVCLNNLYPQSTARQLTQTPCDHCHHKANTAIAKSLSRLLVLCWHIF